ncbi:LHFPL tetraspan subfamily member 3 protein isoform 1-T1 [Spinachia spinachia]
MLPWQEASKIFIDTYIRNSRAIGVLWAIFTICLAIINVVVFNQPYWIGDSASTPRAGHFGLFHYCVGIGSSERELSCQGSFSEFGSIPSRAFKTASVFVLMSMVLILGCIGCFAFFFLCNTAAVYKTCAWMQLLCAVCLVIGCMIFPNGWDSEVIRDVCGDDTGSYALGSCSLRWAYILAIIGILEALILSFLAFVLGNRQSDFLREELKGHNKGVQRERAMEKARGRHLLRLVLSGKVLHQRSRADGEAVEEVQLLIRMNCCRFVKYDLIRERAALVMLRENTRDVVDNVESCCEARVVRQIRQGEDCVKLILFLWMYGVSYWLLVRLCSGFFLYAL